MKKALLLVVCCIASAVLTSCKLQDKLFEKQTQSENMVFDNSEFDDVAANFEKALQADPDFAQNYIDLSDSYISAGYPDKAIAVLYRGYEKTHDKIIENKINEFFTKYKYDFVSVDDASECENIFTLSEFNDLKSDDYLVNGFKWLAENEKKKKNTLEDKMPNYIEQIKSIKEIIK